MTEIVYFIAFVIVEIFGLVLLIIGIVLRNSEKSFYKQSCATYGTITGYREDNDPTVSFLHDGKWVNVVCNTSGMTGAQYPPGSRIRIAYQVKNVLSVQTYKVKAMDAPIRPISFERGGLLLFIVGIILCITGVFILVIGII